MSKWNANRFLAYTRAERHKLWNALQAEVRSEINDFNQNVHNTAPRHDAQFECSKCGKCSQQFPQQTVDYSNDFWKKSLERSIKQQQTQGVGYDAFAKSFKWEQNGRLYDMIYVDPKAYQQVYNKFTQILGEKDVYEFGGSMKKVGNRLEIEKVTTGQQKTLSIPSPDNGNGANDWEWHSHPNHCKHNSGQCGLGWPSQADCRNILRRGFMGNKAHIVFAFEGTYVMHLNPETKSRGLAYNERLLEPVMQDVARLTNEFLSRTDKTAYINVALPKWMSAINSSNSPLRCSFYPVNYAPLVPPF